MIPRAAVCAERIVELLDTTPEIAPPAAPVVPAELTGTVELRGVEFRHPGATAPVVADISFVARPGEVTAIIGSTGSGKTTMLDLVPRLFDATAGTVLVDGVDVRQREPEELWARIGMVPQRSYLFTGTVASNLRFGNPDATDDELWAALELAQGADFVRAMPQQLEAPIAQGGTNVSGGQRQRLAIARALLREPAVFLFDDSFSALDLATEARLRAAIAPRLAKATVILVAQRVASIRHAHQILVLDAGKLVGKGTHAQLVATCPPYAEIVESQTEQKRRRHELEPTRASDATPGRPCAVRARHDDARSDGRDDGPAAEGEELQGLGAPAARPARAASGLVIAVFACCTIAVVFTVSGPKILGRATDIIFKGFLGSRPAGTNPTHLAQVMHVRAGQGIDFGGARRRARAGDGALRGCRRVHVAAGLHPQPPRAARRQPAARRRRREADARAARLLIASLAARCSRASPTTSRTSRRACSRR